MLVASYVRLLCPLFLMNPYMQMINHYNRSLRRLSQSTLHMALKATVLYMALMPTMFMAADTLLLAVADCDKKGFL